MSPEFKWSWRDIHFWRNVVIQATAVVALLIAVILLITSLNQVYGRNPPIQVQNHDPKDLGELCPGDPYPVHNLVTIDSPVVVFYYLSTMEPDGLANIVGTQIPFPGFPHPRPGTFEQAIDWVVPDLPPGRYLRVFAIRGTDGDEKPVHVENSYTIPEKEKCNS